MKALLFVLLGTAALAFGVAGLAGRHPAKDTPHDPEYPTAEMLLFTHANAQRP
jgi:hypothetical protein